MRRMLLAALTAAVISSPMPAQVAREPEVEAVIQSQIEAFKADDFVTAFTFASPSIRAIFGSAERFGTMVRQGYPMVWRPDSVTYLDAERRGDRVMQTVLVRDGAGRLHTLQYEMISGQDGWRINGVRILPSNPVGA